MDYTTFGHKFTPVQYNKAYLKKGDCMGIGTLKVQLYVGDFAFHGEKMTVLIKKDGKVIHTLEANENGSTGNVTLECPDIDADVSAGPSLFRTYDVVVPAANGFMKSSIYGVQIFDGIPSILNIHLDPYVESGPQEQEIYIPLEHGVDIDRDNGLMDNASMNNRPMPEDMESVETMEIIPPADPPTPRNVPLANEVVVPEFITVHLGSPNNTNARQVRVPFRDYVVNVCCSEIYPTWERAAIEANVHAQVSFALNRLFTHWYRSRGRNFDITSDYNFDQVFIYGRNIFQNVALIVDGIFNQFVRRPGRIEPFLTSYCNGSPYTTWSRCAGMSQHGSQILARRGFTPIQILRYYYPQDINIVQSTNFGPRNPGAYPGAALREGSSGINVRRMQLYLNRISGNWWIPAIRNPNGFFGADTRETVMAFQRLFNLSPDGVIGPVTWYEITRVYVAARRMAELDSEGQRYSIGSNPPTVVLRLGARGEAVVELQFLLNFIGQFYNDLPFVIEDNVFRDSTRLAVIAFQRRFGLNPDGVVGPMTWNRLYEVYRRLRNTVPPPNPPPGTPPIPPFPGTPLQVGTRSNDVRILQSNLNGIARCNPSIETLTVDGVFGPRTQGAVREFQRLFNMTQDGIVNRATWYRVVDEFNLLQGTACPTPPPPPPPPTPRPPFPGTSLRVGSRGEDVRTMQRFLNNIARVFPIIPGNLNEDGIFGPITEASVRAFQTFFGLNSDGVIGPLTWGRIVDINATMPNITAPRFPGNLQVGSRGDDVRIVQQYLNDLVPFHPSIPRLTVDGSFGPITQSAVIAFQRIFGFQANGIVNQTTWNFLVSLRNLQTQMSRTASAPRSVATFQPLREFNPDSNNTNAIISPIGSLGQIAQIGQGEQKEQISQFEPIDQFFSNGSSSPLLQIAMSLLHSNAPMKPMSRNMDIIVLLLVIMLMEEKRCSC